MSRKVSRLTLDRFEELRAPCRTCLFWELDPVRRAQVCDVEAFGDRGVASGLHGQRCAAPEEFLARVGFKTYRPHPTAPRLRMELKGAVRWREEVEGALERLIGVVRPKHTAPKATPTSRKS